MLKNVETVSEKNVFVHPHTKWMFEKLKVVAIVLKNCFLEFPVEK